VFCILVVGAVFGRVTCMCSVGGYSHPGDTDRFYIFSIFLSVVSWMAVVKFYN
jgi:hypothetical protein